MSGIHTIAFVRARARGLRAAASRVKGLFTFSWSHSPIQTYSMRHLCTHIFVCVCFFLGSSITGTKMKKNSQITENTGRRHLKLSRTSNNQKKTDEKIKINKKFAVASGTLCRPVPFRFNPIRSGTIPLDFFDPLRRVDSVRGTLLPFGRQFLAAWPLLVRDHKRKNAHAFASPTQKTLRKWPQRWLGQVRQCCCCCRWPNSLRQISVNVSSASSLSLARLLSSLTLCVSFSVWLSIYLSLCLSPSM